jgi:hypothetical protein
MAGNILHTILDKEFRDFIKNKLRAREQKVVKNKSRRIQSKDGFVKIFKSMHSISLSMSKTFVCSKEQI